MKNNQILFLIPKGLKEGQPAFERISSFIEFYRKQNVKVHTYSTPSMLNEKIRLVTFIYKNSIKNIFLSMPPFRNWFLFLLPCVYLILDIRDGWSIAIKRGYGGITKPDTVKAWICKIVEKITITKSLLTITCTTGLKTYLENLSKKEILLITNGSSQRDKDMVQTIIKTVSKDDFETAICIGKFSEAGKDKVQLILEKINKRKVKTKIKLIGSDLEKNKWIAGWLKEKEINNIEISISPWMSRSEMFQELMNSDYGLFTLRDADYEFGTKIFDYILCSIPLFNYFDEENAFTSFFKPYFLESKDNSFAKEFLREDILIEQKTLLLKYLK